MAAETPIAVGARRGSARKAAASASQSLRAQGKRPPGAKREILDAAALLLSRDGYDATTVRTIATRVGIKAGSIYHHFASKDILVQEVLDEGVGLVRADVEAALAALPAGADARTRIRAAIEAHLRAFLEHSAYTSATIKTFTQLPEPLRAQSRVHRREYETIWLALVEALVAERFVAEVPRPEMLRLYLLGAMNWAAEWYRPGKLSIAEIAEDLTILVSRGGPGDPGASTGER